MTFNLQIAIIFLLVFRFAGSSAIAQDNGRLNELLSEPDIQKQINILMQEGDEKESLRVIDEAIKMNPAKPSLYYLRGIFNNNRQKFAKALDDFTKAIDLNPGQELLYRCYLGRGVSYMGLVEYEQALSDLNTSIEHNDTVASALYSRGMVNYELHDYEASVNDFSKILEFSDGNAGLFFNLGMAYFRMNEKDKACQNLNKACTMGSTNACRMSLMECAKAIPVIP